MRKLFSILIVFLATLHTAFAQCAMCKASAETSMESSTQAAGINTGVLYVLFFVFIVLSFFVFLFLKGKNAKDS
jgi:phosphoglycerol transferase MdoB-like AlkP superfamily enzyme